MKKNEEAVLLYSLAAYLGASLLVVVLILLFSLAAMKGFFGLARYALGTEAVYSLKPLLCDSLGFSLAAAGAALAQYYLMSFLRLIVDDRPFLAVLAGFAALFSGLLFWRGALGSSLGAYGFSGLCVTLGALLGALEAVYQKTAENPWPARAAQYFK